MLIIWMLFCIHFTSMKSRYIKRMERQPQSGRKSLQDTLGKGSDQTLHQRRCTNLGISFVQIWRYTNKHMNRWLHHMSPRNCLLKQRDTNAHLSDWPKSKALTASNTDEDVEQQELSFIAAGDAKWCSLLGRQWGGILQTWHSYPMIQQSHSLIFT